ncbi:oxysterol-binding protein-related protein 11-like isoform X2 [Ischnura elegans]|uniref:oxysterol-binding protein-related protein 11-like isoform X2 n=1 Tax=Ischnura elegans TaxID=197161 RepID=UPI001ED8778C|nr:oxysterol-binding protein-related protein 11-like isoform X2 [Ischnura elegans]
MTSDKLRQVFEGQLNKYTNVMKGWQYRFFILDPETGLLQYYLNETENRQRPRGTVHLAGAVISPSDEDSSSFAVNSATGEMYKLRATDARERQEWVNRLRAVAEMHTLAIARSNPPLPPREYHSTQQSHSSALQGSRVTCTLAVLDAFSKVREQLFIAEQNSYSLSKAIESLPSTGSSTSTDHDLLILKATSAATLTCLSRCLAILQQQQLAPITSHSGNVPLSLRSVPSMAVKKATQSTVGKISPMVNDVKSLACPSEHGNQGNNGIDEYVTDDESSEIEDFHLEENKAVILQILSHMKRGMDLTNVNLPTFILEGRSLLELLADCFNHPALFVRIADEETPEKRMSAFLEWYLTCFHAGRKHSYAKKPYNPVLGETFRCCWKVPDINETGDKRDIIVTFKAEQVSHHPPVSALYVECPEKELYLTASLCTKSNFSGMSVGVNFNGDFKLAVTSYNEEYNFNLPSAYARSIISIPWIELGGKVNINCSASGFSASVVFHTKSYYGGKANQVSGEVKDSNGAIICKLNGEWNKNIEIVYQNGSTKEVNIASLPIVRKRLRKLSKQGEYESRKLWHHVTQAIKNKEFEKATAIKMNIEHQQRILEKNRQQVGAPFISMYFHKVGSTWVYNKQ